MEKPHTHLPLSVQVLFEGDEVGRVLQNLRVEVHSSTEHLEEPQCKGADSVDETTKILEQA